MSYPETSLDKDAVTSALVAPIPVPTHGAGGNFAVIAKVHISASPLAALSAVRDTSTWPTWNTFCPACTFPPESSNSDPKDWLHKDTNAVITYVMGATFTGSSGKQGITITVLDIDFIFTDSDRAGKKGCRIGWIGTGRAHWQLHSERIMEFVDDGEGGCDYVCWETFGGVLSGTTKMVVGGKLRDRFGDYARDLKGFVEGGSLVNG